MAPELIAAQLPSGLYDHEVPEREEPRVFPMPILVVWNGVDIFFAPGNLSTAWSMNVYGFAEAA